jgi:hypothetical protein
MVHYGRMFWETLGGNEKTALDVWLAKQDPAALKKLHQAHSFKIGSAMTGVFINGFLMCIFPSNVVSTTLNVRDLVAAIRSRRKIEEAAKAYHGRDLQEGCDRASKKRHLLAGAALRSAMTVLFLGHDDFLAAASNLAGLDLALPASAAEALIKEVSELFYTSSGIRGLHHLSDHLCPANKLIDALGFKQNPTWDQLFLEGGMSFVAVAGVGIGLAGEANVATRAADAAVENAYQLTL